jgi:transcription elongation GreA/GreB family factor
VPFVVKNIMTFKQKIKQHHLVLLQDKIDVYQDMISGLSNDAQNDAKGSAGDKHETALSMMHLEQEKLTNKLKETIALKDILEKIDVSKTTATIALGSYVKVNTMQLFISAALPKIVIDEITILSVSPQSPLGSKLMGKKQGEIMVVNETSFTIHQVL